MNSSQLKLHYCDLLLTGDFTLFLLPTAEPIDAPLDFDLSPLRWNLEAPPLSYYGLLRGGWGT